MRKIICFNVLVIVSILQFCSLIIHAQTIPVSHYTGKPVVSIPLFEVRDRSLAHHVSMYYDASGIKVNDTEDWAGLKWSLMAGGHVTRELRGLPDDFYSGSGGRNGWLKYTNAAAIGSYTFPANGSGLSCLDEDAVFSFINGLNYVSDPEPDVFHFAAEGLSGSFMFDNSGNIENIRLIPYQDVKVKAYVSNVFEKLERFDITTADGTVYVFDEVEVTSKRATKESGALNPYHFKREYEYCKNPLTYNSSWKLSSITTVMGERITFSYTSYADESGKIVKYADAVSANDSDVPGETIAYHVSEELSLKRLTSIQSASRQVSFYSVFEGVTDKEYLDKIVINDINYKTSVFNKSISFSYKKIYSEDEGYARRLLMEINQADACKALQPYKFSYYGIDFSRSNPGSAIRGPGSHDQDIWGFSYNVSVTGHNYPKLYIYPGLAGISKITPFRITGRPDEIVIPGANRISGSTPATGTLSEIQYPEGAVVKLEYESHQFHNPVTNSAMSGNGLRIKKIETYNGVTAAPSGVRTFEYKKPDNTTSGKILAAPSFAFMAGSHRTSAGVITSFSSISALPTADQWKKLLVRTVDNLSEEYNRNGTVVYEYVTERAGNAQGKVLYTFDIPFSWGDIPAPTDAWNPTYTHIARDANGASCPTPALAGPGYYQYPFVPQTPFHYARGRLLKKSSYKEGESNPENETIYTYTDKAVNPVAIKGLSYESLSLDASTSFFQYGVQITLTNALRVLTSVTTRTQSKLAPLSYLEETTTYTYGNNHAFVSQVASTQSDGTIETTRFRYVKDFSASGINASSSNAQVRMLHKLTRSGQDNTLVESASSRQAPGGDDITYAGSMSFFRHFGALPDSAMIKPESLFVLETAGISDFEMSTVTGSGSSATFNYHPAYRRTNTLHFTSNKGDMDRSEDRQRVVKSFHTDSLTGVPVVSIVNAEPHEVIRSNFDQVTRHDFELHGFTEANITAGGKGSQYALAGWQALSTNNLKKEFVKRPNNSYVFSAWLARPSTDPEAELNPAEISAMIIRVKNPTTLQQLLADTLFYSVSELNTWYYAETAIDLGALTTPRVLVEVLPYVTGSIPAKVDELLLAPENAWVERYNFFVNRQTSVVSVENRFTESHLNDAGELQYVTDHEGNMTSKVTTTSWLKEMQTNAPISISTVDIIYAEEETILNGNTACLDISSIEWKVAPASNPSSGAFFHGSDEEPYTFLNAGNYIVTFKVSHSSYGSYEVSKTVTVLMPPLDVDICVQSGPILVDYCISRWDVPGTVTCSGQPYRTTASATEFVATPSGCSPGATYTYQWKKREGSIPNSPWVVIGSNTASVSVTNTFSYDVKCVVTSSCGRTGESQAMTVTVYSGDLECPEGL